MGSEQSLWRIKLLYLAPQNHLWIRARAQSLPSTGKDEKFTPGLVTITKGSAINGSNRRVPCPLQKQGHTAPRISLSLTDVPSAICILSTFTCCIQFTVLKIGSPYIAQLNLDSKCSPDSLKFAIFLPLLPKCWELPFYQQAQSQKGFITCIASVNATDFISQ